MPQKKVGSIIVKYEKSDRPAKKWMTTRPDGKVVYFGSPAHEDFTQHHDLERRKRFRARMAGIILKSGPNKGKKAIDIKFSPAWLSYYVTW